MRVLLLLGALVFLPRPAWGTDAVNIRISVVLAKEQNPQAQSSATETPQQAFPGEYRLERCKKRGTCKEAEEGTQLEAEDLHPMQKALAPRRHYEWFKRFSKKRAAIDTKGETIELPGGNKASVRLKTLKDDVATLVVSLPKTETIYQLGRTGSLYLQAGKHEGNEVWVVISPAKRPSPAKRSP
ncbi:MAG: hypothetical protein FWG75_09660 [Cystobacterineae bacterium]|nr:hypothetical protein [Cystobacterineae bacterium]